MCLSLSFSFYLFTHLAPPSVAAAAGAITFLPTETFEERSRAQEVLIHLDLSSFSSWSQLVCVSETEEEKINHTFVDNDDDDDLDLDELPIH